MSIKQLYELLSVNIDNTNGQESIIQTLVGISARTKNRSDINDLYDCDGYNLLYNLLRSHNDRITPVVLSILANCCNICEKWRQKIQDCGCLPIVVDILGSTLQTDVISGIARLFANLAKDSANLPIFQDKFLIDLLVSKCSLSHSKSLMACLRALRYICATRKTARLAIECKKFPDLVGLLNETSSSVVILSFLQMLCELLKNRIPEVCHRIMECEILNKLCEHCKHDDTDIQNKAYEILFLLSLNSASRVTVAMEGALEVFAERIQTLDNQESFKFATQCICLFAREAVSRNRMKTAGTLPYLAKILDDENLVCFHESIVAACVMFIFDDLSLGIMIKAGLIRAMLKYLDRLTGVEFKRNLENIETQSVNIPNISDLAVNTEIDVPSDVQPLDRNYEVPSSAPNEDVIAYERQHCWSNSSPETSPYHANSPPYHANSPPYHVPNGYSPPHSPYSYTSQISYSPPHSPNNSWSLQYSASSPKYNRSPQASGFSPQYSPQHSHVSPRYSPQHSPSSYHKIADDVYSDPLNDSTCSTEQVPYHHQSADGLYAMIHGTRGPVHDILLLLSRFSQATDPSSFFLVLPEFNNLLNYLLLSSNPKPKCARVLNRLTQNSHCFDIMLKEKLIVRLYLRLCTGWSLEHLVKLYDDAKDKYKSGGDICSTECDEELEDNLYKWKSPSQATLSLVNLLVTNIRSQCDSSYGRGVLTHILLTGSKVLKETVAISLPHIVRKSTQHRVFRELKAARILMDMLTRFHDISSEVFVLCVEAICVLANLTGLTREKLPDLESIVCFKVAEKEADTKETDIEGEDKERNDCEPPAKKRRVPNNETKRESSKLISFKLPSGKVISCESTFLVNHSRVFERMLSHTYIDSTKKFIEISEVNEDAFSKLIHFICGCSINLDGSLDCAGVCVHQMLYKDAALEKDASKTEEQKTIDSHLNEDSTHSTKVNELPQKRMTVDENISCSSENPLALQSQQHDIRNEPVDIHNISMQLAPSMMSVMNLLSCSERFFVETLKSKCENFLINFTSSENVVDIFFLSSLHNSFLLKKHALNYLLLSIECPMIRTKSFAEILHSNEKDSFLQFLQSEILSS